MCSGTVYLLFAKSEVQPWNDPENMKKDPEKPTAELELLKKVENEDNENSKPQFNDKAEEKLEVSECK